jgi:hypothetical protein
MSYSLPPERTMLRCFIAGFQAAKPTLCLPKPAATEFTPKQLLATVSSPLNRALIFRIGLAPIRKARVPLTHAAAVPLKSP